MKLIIKDEYAKYFSFTCIASLANGARNFFLILILFLLTACPPIGPECLGPPDTDFASKYNINQYVVDVNSESEEWIDSGHKLTLNQLWEAKIIGTISYDTWDKIITLNPSTSSGTFTRFEDGNELTVEEEEIIAISVNGNYNSSSPINKYCHVNSNIESRPLCNESSELSSGCIATNGKGLAVIIGNQVIKNFDYSFFPQIKDYIPKNSAGVPVVTIDSNKRVNKHEVETSVNSRSYIFKTGGKRGKLGFRYLDCNNCFGDNYGYYVLRVQRSMQNSLIENGLGKKGDNFRGSVEYIVAKNKPDKTTNGEIVPAGTIRGQSAKDGKLWFRVKDAPGAYNNNQGSYIAYLTLYTLKTGAIGRFLNTITKPVKEKTREAAQIIYSNFEKDPRFHLMIRAMLMLYIMIYGIYFIFGMAEITQHELVERAVKIGIVSILLTKSSWQFFNDYFLKLFTTGADKLLLAATGTSTDSESGIFGFVDIVIHQFFNADVWIKISSFIFILIGFVYIVIIVHAIFTYTFVIAEAFVGYLMVVISISFLISLAPLFLSLILFERTREYFKNWHRYLLNFALQPIVLFLALSIMNELIMGAFWNLMDFKICWGCVLPIYLDLNFLFGWLPIPLPDMKIDLFCINFYKNPDQILELLPNMLVFLILVSSLKSFLNFAPQLTDMLTQVMPGSSTNTTGGHSFAHGVVDSAAQNIKGLVGQDRDSIGRRKRDAKDAKDSGETKDKLKEELKAATQTTTTTDKEDEDKKKKKNQPPSLTSAEKRKNMSLEDALAAHQKGEFLDKTGLIDKETGAHVSEGASAAERDHATKTSGTTTDKADKLAAAAKAAEDGASEKPPNDQDRMMQETRANLRKTGKINEQGLHESDTSSTQQKGQEAERRRKEGGNKPDRLEKEKPLSAEQRQERDTANKKGSVLDELRKKTTKESGVAKGLKQTKDADGNDVMKDGRHSDETAREKRMKEDYLAQREQEKDSDKPPSSVEQRLLDKALNDPKQRERIKKAEQQKEQQAKKKDKDVNDNEWE